MLVRGEGREGSFNLKWHIRVIYDSGLGDLTDLIMKRNCKAFPPLRIELVCEPKWRKESAVSLLVVLENHSNSLQYVSALLHNKKAYRFFYPKYT